MDLRGMPRWLNRHGTRGGAAQLPPRPEPAPCRVVPPVVPLPGVDDGQGADGWHEGLGQQSRTILLYGLAMVGYSANAFLELPRTYHVLLFFAITAGLCWLIFASLRRQHGALAQLRAHQQTLANHRALLQSTVENMGEGLSVFDRTGGLIAWNSQFAQFLRLPIDLTTTSLQEILLLEAMRGDFGPVDDPEREARERFDRFYRDVPAVIEFPALRGHTLQIRRRGMPDGCVVSLYSDITERKAAEEEMKEARVQAELANRAKSDFLANMSHELRTPLNAIIGFSEVISSEILGPVADKRQLEYMKDIHSSGLLLLSIINDVLDMSKIEAGKMELLRERVEVPGMIGEAVRMVSELANSRDIRVVSHAATDHLTVLADERALTQIMLNLLSNAVKFSNAGGQVELRALTDAGGSFVLEVEDYGVGMTEDEVERALQPFGQASPATTKSHGGTGLGLPIARGLAEAHGGTLLLQSAPGRGTLVRVVLPPPQTEIPEAIETLLRDISGSKHPTPLS